MPKSWLEHPESWPEEDHPQAVITPVSLEGPCIAYTDALKSEERSPHFCNRLKQHVSWRVPLPIFQCMGGCTRTFPLVCHHFRLCTSLSATNTYHRYLINKC